MTPISKRRRAAGLAAFAVGGALLGACARPTTTDISAGASASSISTTSPAPLHRRLLVSADELGSSSADLGGAQAAATPPSTVSSAAPPKAVHIAADHPLVKAVQAKLAVPLPFNRAGTIGGATFVIFGTSGQETLTIRIQKITAPFAPTMADRAAFQEHYTQRPDGTEQYVEDGNPSAQHAVQTVSPTGQSVSVADETHTPGPAPLHLTLEQVRSLSAELTNLALPGA